MARDRTAQVWVHIHTVRGWQGHELAGRRFGRYVSHVTPVDDLREHTFTKDCWCKPTMTRLRPGTIYVHNSEDGRELIEAHGLQ